MDSDPRLGSGIGIPPCPAILTRLMRETRADEPDFTRIGELIQRDVALAAAVLKVANSSFYGLRNKAGTVRHALTLLGLRTVTQVVTGLLLHQAFPAAPGSGMEHFWKSSMANALAATFVARETGRADVGTAHAYGLFRDCGMAVMLREFAGYADILNGSALESGCGILDIERERYGTDHCRVGLQLAESWQLSDQLRTAIRRHHELLGRTDLADAAMSQVRLLVALGLVAEHLYCRMAGEPCYDWARDGEYASEILDLDSARLELLSSRLAAAFRG